MTWIGLCDSDGALFDPSGLPAEGATSARLDQTGEPQLATRGTILLEVDFHALQKPNVLLDYRRDHPWASRIRLTFEPDGTLVLDIKQGSEVLQHRLATHLRETVQGLDITYGWDAPARSACLSVYNPVRCTTSQLVISNPRPLVLDDLRLMTMSSARRHLGRDVTFMAISNQIEPIGPMPGLASHAVIEVSTGPTPISRLHPGDFVYTQEAQPEPVISCISRTLPARGRFRPLRLRRPYFGLSRDLIVSAETQILMRGPDVEYLFGEEAVLVVAGHLTDSQTVVPVQDQNVMRYHQILCADPEVLNITRCAIASLYVGDLARDRVAAATTVLAGFPAGQAPIHDAPAYPVLQGYEAITLASSRVA